MASLYLHVPFCHSICYYCAFCRTVPTLEKKQAWLVQILQDLSNVKTKLDTVYIGGGTPNVLTEDEFTKIVDKIGPLLNSDCEFTVECNPEFITREQIQLYKNCGVNRISLGVQTFNKDALKRIGRKHNVESVFQSIAWIKEEGIQRISIDLIFGLPNQTMEDVKTDLDQFFSLEIDHLSIYSLQIEKNSIFGKQGLKPIDENLEADMYEYIISQCKAHGFEHYEVSSFSRNKQYSKHNLVYWSDQDFIGIGCGASGKIGNMRYTNTNDLNHYILKGADPVYEESDPFDAIMMALRTSFGLDIAAWQEKYNIDFFRKYGSVLNQYKNLLVLDQGHLKCNEKGFEILNTILVDFLMCN